MVARAPVFPSYSHDKDAVLDYPFDWAASVDKNGKPVEPWLTPDDSIVSASVTPLGADSPLTVDAIDLTDGFGLSTRTAGQSGIPGSAVVAWISARSTANIAVVGQQWTVTCHIVTAQAREEDQSIVLVIHEH